MMRHMISSNLTKKARYFEYSITVFNFVKRRLFLILTNLNGTIIAVQLFIIGIYRFYSSHMNPS